jgi:hypothetical protein
MDDIPITFEDWETVLIAAAPPDRYPAWREAIVKFRYWLRQTSKPPTASTFKEHLDWKKTYLTPERFEIRREALRWYYREGLSRMKGAAGQAETPPSPARAESNPRRVPDRSDRATSMAERPHSTSSSEGRVPAQPRKPHKRIAGGYRTYEMNDVPTAGARDLGGPPWEQALVRRIRERNLAWTSEKTYRAWCRRFIESRGGKPVGQLDHGDVRQWLSDLAVKERVSGATQSQALNAVVFFFREVMQRDPGDFSDFTRARRGRKVPTAPVPAAPRPPAFAPKERGPTTVSTPKTYDRQFGHNYDQNLVRNNYSSTCSALPPVAALSPPCFCFRIRYCHLGSNAPMRTVSPPPSTPHADTVRFSARPGSYMATRRLAWINIAIATPIIMRAIGMANGYRGFSM